MIMFMTSEPDHHFSGMLHLIRNFHFSRLYLFHMVPLKKIKGLAIFQNTGKNQQSVERAVGFFFTLNTNKIQIHIYE